DLLHEVEVEGRANRAGGRLAHVNRGDVDAVDHVGVFGRGGAREGDAQRILLRAGRNPGHRFEVAADAGRNVVDDILADGQPVLGRGRVDGRRLLCNRVGYVVAGARLHGDVDLNLLVRERRHVLALDFDVRKGVANDVAARNQTGNGVFAV